MNGRGLYPPGMGPAKMAPDTGFKTPARGFAPGTLPREIVNNLGNPANEEGNTYRYHGLVTYEKPIKEFTGDIAVAALTDITFQNGGTIPNNCVGFRLISVVPPVQVSINNSPLATVTSGDNFTGWEITNLRVVTGAGASCTVQAWGTGD